jgi:phosphate transport system substrate-binding protein
MARLQNKEGRFVTPSEGSGRAALASAARQMPDNLRLYVPDPEGDDSYPIVSLTWLLLYERYPDQQKSAALRRFVTWGLSFGQSFGPELGYIALPADVASRSRAAVERIQ